MEIQLIYHSIATKDISSKDIKEILKIAKVNNALNGITGCLLYHNGYFLQLLEGRYNAVQGIFDSIKRDRRHDKVKEIYRENCYQRIFWTWDMYYEELRLSDIEKIKDELGIPFAKNQRQLDLDKSSAWNTFKQISESLIKTNRVI